MGPSTDQTLGAWPDVSRWTRQRTVRLELTATEPVVGWRQLELLSELALADVGRGEGQVRAELRHALTSVATELVENALHNAPEGLGIELAISTYRSTVCVESRNRTTFESVQHLRSCFERMSVEAPEEMVRRTIEARAAEGSSRSGIGLYKLRSDHDLGLGARVSFDSDGADVVVRAIIDFPSSNQRMGRTPC